MKVHCFLLLVCQVKSVVMRLWAAGSCVRCLLTTSSFICKTNSTRCQIVWCAPQSWFGSFLLLVHGCGRLVHV